MNKFVEYRYFIVAFVILVGAFYIAGAFTSPSQAPPSGNVPTPLDTSATAQTKQGNLTLNGTLAVPSGSVTATQLCLGGVCKSTWPPELRPTDIGAVVEYNVQGSSTVLCSTPCGCIPSRAGCNWAAGTRVSLNEYVKEDARNILSLSRTTKSCYTGWDDNRDGACDQTTWDTDYLYSCNAPWTSSSPALSQELQLACLYKGNPTQGACRGLVCKRP